MGLYQSSVIKKYLKGIESAKIDEAWNRFTAHFHNKAIQENIRNSKEEQYQGEFLIDLFVNVLGYTKNPNPDYNLTTELKNVKGAKKTDGAILQDEKALAVIELKGTKTTDLSKVENQAFGYKNNQPGCVYIITSNFEKLRFYIDNAVDFEEFNLFQITRERFEILWLCLSSEYLLKNIPKQIKDESLTREEAVTKKLYKDYSLFRNEIFDSIQKNNPDYDKLTLFKKTQKLLDRFLFIFFAEDRLLLPPNSIREIINQWTTLRDELDTYVPLYDRFKKYFGYLNTGHRGKKYEIFAYNGGLFAPDEILDSIKIDDTLLYKHTQNLSNYDFETEVSVNILGHIFEHSLNDIEEIQAELEGVETDKGKSKRKKDGVFYTPKYITKYIVDNTVGKLCDEKKTELEIDESEYEKGRKGRKKTILKELVQKLDEYRNWLLQLTICDPACGSGAFLNQALEFLITEHRYIDELNAKLLGEAMVLSDIENSILENNLFGVDINEESVEIAKLSLWLRTAQKGRKLTSLNDNIKCGNSLIDDIKFAEGKAFNWQEEFPKVFESGGFDVIVGNPPYGAELSDKDKAYLEGSFKTFEYQVNTYVIFYEVGLNLLKGKGILGYITPATFTYQHYFSKLRLLLQEYNQIAISKYYYEVFEDADIGDSVTWIIQKSKNLKSEVLVQICSNESEATYYPIVKKYNELVSDDGLYLLSESGLDFNKISKNCENLSEIANIIVGIKPYQTGKGTPKQTKEIVKEKIFTNSYPVDETYLRCVIGKDFHRYQFIREPKMFLSYGIWLAEPRNSAPFFDNNKIIIRQTADSVIATLDDNKWINLNNVYNVGSINEYFNIKYILALLNSKLINLIYQNISQEKGRTFAEVKKVYLAKLPIKNILLESQLKYSSKVETILFKYAVLGKKRNRFLKRLNSSFDIDKLSQKLQLFYSHDFKTFITELKKNKIKLNLSQQDEWEEYFDDYCKKINELQNQINVVKNQIDQMVYELYGLTEEEINIVEESIK